MIPGSFFWLVISVAACSAVPLDKLDRIKRSESEEQSIPKVCIADNSTYQEGEVVPRGFCEICICSEGQIKCTKKTCPENNGCKKVQRANECCPEYICDCHYNNTVFANGQKMKMKEDDPCITCYCKGGEPMCNTVQCYQREDCKPIKVKGQCCPKYDNCPVGNSSEPAIKDTQPWPLTKAEEAQTSPLPSSEASPEEQDHSTTIQETAPTAHSSESTRNNVQITEIYDSQEYKGTTGSIERTSISFKESDLKTISSEESTTEGHSEVFINPSDIKHIEDIMEDALNSTSEPEAAPITAEAPSDMTTDQTTPANDETTLTGEDVTEILKGGTFEDIPDDEWKINAEDVLSMTDLTTEGHESSESGADVAYVSSDITQSRELSGAGSLESVVAENLSPTPISPGLLANDLPYLSYGGGGIGEIEEKPTTILNVNVINLTFKSNCAESFNVSKYSLNLKADESKKLVDLLQGDQPHNQTVLIFNNSAEKNEWAQGVFQQIVSNLNKPLDVEYVDEIITLNTTDVPAERSGPSSENTDQEPTELSTDLTTEGPVNFTDISEQETNAIYDSTTVEITTILSSSEEPTTGEELNEIQTAGFSTDSIPTEISA